MTAETAVPTDAAGDVPPELAAAIESGLQAEPSLRPLADHPLAKLTDKGLAHDHLRLVGSGLLLRIPKQSQRGYAPADNLRYQAACFARVSESGHGPKLASVLAPRDGLPFGALVVEEIAGRPPKLPEELPALAACMAKVHALPLPPLKARPPLEDHVDPVAGLLTEIEEQARFIPDAGLAAESRQEIEAELAWGRDFAAGLNGAAQPVTLVLTDSHPGNFLIDDSGKATIVDLEKALYGSPGVDLAHSTVYSSTTWDLDVYAELSQQEVAAFYRHYLEIVEEAGAAGLAARLRPWLIPMRRLLFLRAITWCVMWSVQHQGAAKPAEALEAGGSDWSASKSEAALIAHVAGRVAEYLRPDIIARMRGEWLAASGLDDLI